MLLPEHKSLSDFFTPGHEILQNAEAPKKSESDILKSLRLHNLNRLIIGSLNINSLSNKFDDLKVNIQGRLDILVLNETKLDSSFPTNQFLIEGFSKPYRFDRNRNGGGVMLYIREDIPSKLLRTHNLPSDIEAFFVELNLRKTKWLLSACYRPPKQSDDYFFKQMSAALDTYGTHYSKFLLIGDFNAEVAKANFAEFLECHDAKSLIKVPYLLQKS